MHRRQKHLKSGWGDKNGSKIAWGKRQMQVVIGQAVSHNFSSTLGQEALQLIMHGSK